MRLSTTLRILSLAPLMSTLVCSYFNPIALWSLPMSICILWSTNRECSLSSPIEERDEFLTKCERKQSCGEKLSHYEIDRLMCKM